MDEIDRLGLKEVTFPESDILGSAEGCLAPYMLSRYELYIVPEDSNLLLERLEDERVFQESYTVLVCLNGVVVLNIFLDKMVWVHFLGIQDNAIVIPPHVPHQIKLIEDCTVYDIQFTKTGREEYLEEKVDWTLL